MILILSALTSLLSQLVSPQSSPHSAILISRLNGSVIAQQSVPTTSPWPPRTLDDRNDEERARLYAAVGSSTWEEVEEEGRAGREEGEVLRVETELGRINIIAIGSFLLILVGSHVAPWHVLEKKIRLAEEQLKEPLQRIAQ